MVESIQLQDSHRLQRLEYCVQPMNKEEEKVHSILF